MNPANELARKSTAGAMSSGAAEDSCAPGAVLESALARGATMG
jgi:hypothetical protein